MRMTEIRKELIEKFDELIEYHNMGDITLNNWEEEFLSNIGLQLEAEDGYLTDLQIEKFEEVYERYTR